MGDMKTYIKFIIKFITVTTAAVVLLAAGLMYWMHSCRSFMDNTLVSGNYVIEKGQPYRATYNELFDGLNPPPGFNIYLVHVLKLDSRIRFGYYEAVNITVNELVDNIIKGQQTLIKVTFPEGYNMYDVASTLDSAGIADREQMLDIFSDKRVIARLTGGNYETLEGFLAPGTYFFSKNFPGEKIAAAMVEEFYRLLPFDFEMKAREHGLTFYDAVKVASIVQKETYKEEEAPLVAAVFINRLNKRMRIQADPTIIYGIYADFNGKLSKTELTDRSNRFNTYRHNGLPPTPISNPSKMALEAVASPAESDYMYFVATKDGTHVFAKSYDEHLRNVNIHQRGRAN